MMDIKDTYIDLEEELLSLIASHLGQSEEIRDISNWQIHKLANLNKLTKDAKRRISTKIKEVPDELDNLINTAMSEETIRTTALYTDVVKKGYILKSANEKTISRNLRKALDSMYNDAYNKFNITNASILKSVKQKYSKLVNDAALLATSKTTTTKEAIRKCISDLSEEGLTGFRDKAGREWSPEAYVSMIIKGTKKNVVNATVFSNADKFGCKLFEVSSHAAARPKCYPYQNKIVSKDGTAGTIKDGNGKTIEFISLSSTSYGEPDGLLGINCGHYLFPFIPGVSVLSNKTQEQGENDKAYTLSQMQRKLERDVRKTKRKVGMMDKLGDKEAVEDAMVLLKRKQQALRNFITDTGRTRRYDREQVYTVFGKQGNSKQILSYFKGKSPYNGDILDIDDRLLKIMDETQDKINKLLPGAFSDIEIFKNAIHGEVFSMELFVDTMNGNVLRKSFNFGTQSSDLNILKYSIEKNVSNKHWFQGTTIESIIMHEGVHDYLFSYALKKNGLKVGDSVTIKQWKKITQDIVQINAQIAQEAKQAYPKSIFGLKEDLGRYAMGDDQELVAQAVSKYFTVGSDNAIVKYIAERIRDLK